MPLRSSRRCQPVRSWPRCAKESNDRPSRNRQVLQNLHLPHARGSHLRPYSVSLGRPDRWPSKAAGDLRPPGFKETFRKLLQGTSTPDDFFKFPLTLSELNFGETKGNVRTCRTSHTIPTLAFRIESDGRSFCYTADTIYCPAVVELSRNVDLLLHDATFLEDQLPIAELTYHSTARMAGRAAKEANAKRLVLFHIPPPNERREGEFYSAAKHEYGDEVTVAKDMAAFSF